LEDVIQIFFTIKVSAPVVDEGVNLQVMEER
jgi:hypothetical protein